MYLTLKAIFAFRAIHRFAFLYRTLNFTHNLKKNLDIRTLKSIFYVYLSSFFRLFFTVPTHHFCLQGYFKVKCLLLYSRRQYFFLFALKLGKAAVIKRVSYILHKMIVKPQIMHNRKPLRKHFLTFKQMPDIRLAVPAANGAAAVFVYRGHIVLVFFIVEIYNSL